MTGEGGSARRAPGSRLFRLNALVLGFYVVGTVLVWPRVPDRVPIHFGFGGAADGWADAATGWFILPLVAVSTAALIAGAMRLARTSPELWNVPDRQRFLALPESERAPIVATLERFVGLTALFVTLVFVVLHAGIYSTAVGWTDGLPGPVTLFIFGGVAAVLVAALVMNRRLAARVRRLHEARGSD